MIHEYMIRPTGWNKYFVFLFYSDVELAALLWAKIQKWEKSDFYDFLTSQVDTLKVSKERDAVAENDTYFSFCRWNNTCLVGWIQNVFQKLLVFFLGYLKILGTGCWNFGRHFNGEVIQIGRRERGGECQNPAKANGPLERKRIRKTIGAITDHCGLNENDLTNKGLCRDPTF